MIKVHVVTIALPTQNGMENVPCSLTSFISPHRIDTISEVTDAMPGGANAVIRYDDVRMGYRMLYVKENAEELAKARRHEMNGLDSDDPMGFRID